MAVLSPAGGLHQARNKEADGYSHEEADEKCEHGGTPLSSIVWYGARERGSRLCLLSKPVADGAGAKEEHNPDFAVETLEKFLDPIAAAAQSLGCPIDGLRPSAHERDEVSFFCGQLINVWGLTHDSLPFDESSSTAGLGKS
jgi:hypothetical protein